MLMALRVLSIRPKMFRFIAIAIIPYRMGPPKVVVVEANALPRPSPTRPGILDWNAGKNRRDDRRNHKEKAVDDSTDANEAKLSVREYLHKKADDGDLG